MIVEPSIPLTDFGLFLNGSTHEKEQVTQAIDAAFRSVGFLYMTNYGIDADGIDACFRQSRRFFSLSGSEKNSIECPIDRSLYRGYVGVGRDKVRERTASKKASIHGTRTSTSSLIDGHLRICYRDTGLSWRDSSASVKGSCSNC